MAVKLIKQGDVVIRTEKLFSGGTSQRFLAGRHLLKRKSGEHAKSEGKDTALTST